MAIPRSRSARVAKRDGGGFAGCGVAFISFGVLGLLRASGVHVDGAWLCSAVAIGLGRPRP